MVKTILNFFTFFTFQINSTKKTSKLEDFLGKEILPPANRKSEIHGINLPSNSSMRKTVVKQFFFIIIEKRK